MSDKKFYFLIIVIYFILFLVVLLGFLISIGLGIFLAIYGLFVLFLYFKSKSNERSKVLK